VVANGLRNVWACVVIVCGHFADRGEKFTPSVPEVETKPEWNLGQMLGIASFQAATVVAFVSGNLCYRIEYDRFPDPPSNRCPRSPNGCALCALPTTGPLLCQYLLTVRTICKLAFPDRFLFATFDDAPETASENGFRKIARRSPLSGSADDVRRRGLARAILARNNRGQPREGSA
jgi:NADPH-dependent stearoyl-CoA 9-desaturase